MSQEVYFVTVILLQTVVIALLCYFRGSKGPGDAGPGHRASAEESQRPVHPHEHVYLSECGSVVHATPKCSKIRNSRNVRRFGICRVCGGHIRAACNELAGESDGHES